MPAHGITVPLLSQHVVCPVAGRHDETEPSVVLVVVVVLVFVVVVVAGAVVVLVVG